MVHKNAKKLVREEKVIKTKKHIDKMKAIFENFEISSKYLGNKCCKHSGMTENWNNHRITVKNTETKKRCTFEFWASIMNPVIETEIDLLEAFECFVMDSIAGNMYFEDFCSEYGYDANSRSSEKIHNNCIKSLNKFVRVVDDYLCDFSNRLHYYIEELSITSKQN